MKKVQTYTPPIDEQGNQTLLSVFTNWAGDESTGNLPVSGKAIRELLQSRLQKPFDLYYDIPTRSYRIFRDVADRELWKNRNEYAPGTPEREAIEALSLGDFIAPSPYTLEIFEYGSTERFSNATRYIRAGVKDDSTKVMFSWNITQDDEPYPDDLLVNYTLSNSKYGNKKFPEEHYDDSNRDISFDFYEFLAPGTNSITIDFKGSKSGITSQILLTIKVVTLKLSAQFPYHNIISASSHVPFNITLDYSTIEAKQIYYYIDGGNAQNLLGQNTNVPNDIVEYKYNNRTSIQIPNLSVGKHTLQLQAETVVNEQSFCSNLLYYEFVIPDYSADVVHYITSEYSYDNVIESGKKSELTLYAEQYKQFVFNWAYVSNVLNENNIESCVWKLIRTDEELHTQTEIEIAEGTFGEISKQSKYQLSFKPYVYSTERYTYVLRATIGSQNFDYPIVISLSDYQVSETADYVLKLTASGKQNTDQTWKYVRKGVGPNDSDVEYTTTFNNFSWNSVSGWNEDALEIAEGTYAEIGFAPFADSGVVPAGDVRTHSIRDFGRTVEIEFEFLNVGDTSEDLIKIGDYQNGFGIKITPNKATMVYKNSEILSTNYKDSERIKLAFIIQPYADGVADQNLLWIVNNGILERCSTNGDIILNEKKFDGLGTIRLGSANSSSRLRIYNIRCYDNAITYEQAFNNFAFDSSDIANVLSRNKVLKDNQIDFDEVSTRIDTILITGQLDLILSASGMQGDSRKQIEIPVTLQRICPTDHSFDFTITDCRIRAHGQSTLNNPVPSFKIWSNKAFTINCGQSEPNETSGNEVFEPDELIETGQVRTPVMYDSNGDEIFEGRYSFKAGAIPSKKWVLQANYADSSCTHNGGILRLIHRSWYDAAVDGQYVFRTDPQQFSTNTGKYAKTSNGQQGLEWGWNHETNQDKSFPYEIRVSADSVPCVIFWKRTKASPAKFLGQFVFMDDKKSDFVFGERSIYNVADDPFCLLDGNKDLDTDENCIWDNQNVLRFEQTTINNPFANFSGLTRGTGTGFKDFDRFDADLAKYDWEDDFELVYPEKEDITSRVNGVKQFDVNKFRKRVEPFMQFFHWLQDVQNIDRLKANDQADVDVYEYLDPAVTTYLQQKEGAESPRSPRLLWSAGTYSSSQEAFQATAADHLDLYKIAAYYIFVLRFGLIDSVQRNAQLKTYDGQHWHFEPWDMDIALGTNNGGQIAFEPPLTFDTPYETTEGAYAYSGHDSALYQMLLAWQTVPGSGVMGFVGKNSYVERTAAALSTAGLTYANAISELDGNYSDKWCERIYNSSGYTKYIERRNYTWLQGARTTHRHWWLKTSFDYWDAEWAVGSFITKALYIKTIASADKHITITPSSTTSFGLAFNFMTSAAIVNKTKITKGVATQFLLNQDSDGKVPYYLFGAPYLRDLDLSDISRNMDKLDLSCCYDDGSNLKSLNIGMTISNMQSPNESVDNPGTYMSPFNAMEFVLNSQFDDEEDHNQLVLDGLDYFNVQGHRGPTFNSQAVEWLPTMQNLKIFKAAGSSLTSFNGPKAQYTTLQLPDSVGSIVLNDASWTLANPLDTNPDTSTGLSFWTVTPNRENNPSAYTFSQASPAFYATTLSSVYMRGSTGRQKCSYDLVMKIIQECKDYCSYQEGGDRTTYRNVLKGISLYIDQIDWSTSSSTYLTYEDLLDLACFNNGDGQSTFLDGSVAKPRLNGIVVMANEGADQALLATQFSKLQEKFGPNIFDKGSEGLTINYLQNTIVLTVGVAAGHDTNRFQFVTQQDSNWKPFNSDSDYSEYYLVDEGYNNGEPYYFPIRATKFSLGQTPPSAQWKMYRINRGSWQETADFFGAQIVERANKKYLMIPELTNVLSNGITEPQNIKLEVTLTDENQQVTQKSTYIRIRPKSYPSATLSCVKISGGTETNIAYKSSFNLTECSDVVYEIRRTLTYGDNTNKATIDPSFGVSERWILEKEEEGCPLTEVSKTDGSFRIKLERELNEDEEFTATVKYKVKFMAGSTTYVQTSCYVSMEIFVCKDANAGLMLQMAYAQTNSTPQTPINHTDVVLTKAQLGSLDILYTPQNANTYARAKALTQTTYYPASAIVHFPEARFLKKNSDIATQEGDWDDYAENYYTNGTLKSFIFPFVQNAPLAINRGCYIGSSPFTLCKYVDYGDYSQWNKHNDLDSNDRKQVMVFWQIPSFYYNNGNNATDAPTNNNIILVPSDKALAIYNSLGTAPSTDSSWSYFPTSLKNRILVFENCERTPDNQYKLWKKFYDAYTADLEDGVADTVANRYANVVTAFMYDENSNPTGFRTIQNYLEVNNLIATPE